MNTQEAKQSFIADKTDYPRFISFVSDYTAQYTDSLRIKNDIAVVMDELFSNVDYYSTKGSSEPAEVTVELSCEAGVLTIVFADSGAPFNPLLKPEPSPEANRRNKTAGGLGIYMVRKLMDSVSYEYKNKNILTLKKKLLEEKP